MAIIWNKVTGYSKAMAVVLFIVVLPIWAFYLGTVYGATKQEAKDLLLDSAHVR